MTLAVVFLPAARVEFEDAVRWYEGEGGLGSEFSSRVYAVVRLITRTPRMYPIVYGSVRRGVVKRFPYNVMYRIEPERVLIISVFHARRDPAVWRKRAQDN